MAKFKIAEEPTFSADVGIPRVGGGSITVPFVFKYRDREALAALFTEWQSRAKADQKLLDEKGDDVTVSDVTEAQIARQIEQVKALVVGWDFEDPVNDESIRAVVVMATGVTEAIVASYQKAFTPARQGN
jgi:hypothetical protein